MTLPSTHMTRALNREINLREYESRATVLQSRPRAVFVELTRNCNLRCFMCKPEAQVPRGWDRGLDMKPELFDRIAATLFPTAELVDLRGIGESTLLKDFELYFDRTVAYGCRPRLVTNLTATTGRILEKLVAHDTMLAVSIDAPEAEPFEAIRQGAKFERVMANLATLTRLRREAGTCRDTCIHMTLHRPTLGHIRAMVEMAARNDIPRLLIWPMDLPPDRGDNLIYHLPEAADAFAAGLAAGDELGVEVRIGDWITRPERSEKVLSRSVCIRPWMYLSITHKGRIGYCDCYSEPPSLRALDFDQSFDDIWNGPTYQRMRAAFAKGIGAVAEVDSGCSRCALKKLVDFDDVLYPPFAARVVNNRSPSL